ncbi:hypothetical protein NX059_010758 [Plenodomus lindquistii]|nr:hypothetical protein NX059_010758 [Plenodomus lindquistii]
MRTFTILAAFGSAATFASPLPMPQGTGGGADSCPSDELSPKTWTDLNIDKVLADAAANYTKTQTNNVQAFADSFGAPNFFCGLDNFCNAGQPCLPVQPPAWYGLVGIQNWNNYANALNTAAGFATSIIGLKLPEIVQDLFPAPKDDITLLRPFIVMSAGVLSMVPVTGALLVGSTAIGTGLIFSSSTAFIPPTADTFFQWSNVASSMGDVLREWQGSISDYITRTIDAPVDDPNNGINKILEGGNFLGVSQNFTQSDLQDLVIDSITVNALGLALQARRAFIVRFINMERCTENDNSLCIQGDTLTGYSLVVRSGDANAGSLGDETKLIVEKYGLTKEQALKGPADCFDKNGKKQLAGNPFEKGMPTDPKELCNFNLQVCEIDNSLVIDLGIVDYCQEIQGLDI